MTTPDLAITASVDEVCLQARELNQEALPQQARALITALRTSLGEKGTAACIPEFNEALRRVARAQQLTTQAQQLPPRPTATATPTASAEAAQESPDASASPLSGTGNSQAAPQECSDQPPSPQTEVAYIQAALRCDSENSDALALSSQIQRAWANWSDLTDRYLAPLKDFVLTLLGMLLGLFLIARLAVPLFPVFPTNTFLLGCQRQSTLVTWVGGALAAFGCLVILTGSWGLGAVLAVLGAVALAFVWSRAMRLSISVLDSKGDSDRAAEGQIIALLSTLGAEAPRGLETPRAADATVLQEAGLTTSPEGGRIVKAFYMAAMAALPTTPWRIRVDVESPDCHSVTITRNGRAATSAVIKRDSLGLRIGLRDADGKPIFTDADQKQPALPDLHSMAAAVVLCALQKAYAFGGLCGTTNWRSLGLHYIATTDLANAGFATSDALALPLLAAAVAEDPDNRLARVALWKARYRSATDTEELTTYLKLLNNYVEQRQAKKGPEGELIETAGGDQALLLRVLYSRVAVGINYHATKGAYFPAKGLNTELSQLRQTYDAIAADRYAHNKEFRGAHEYAKTHKPSVDDLALSVDILTPAPLAAQTPRGFYQHACYRASLFASGAAPIDAAEAFKEAAAAAATDAAESIKRAQGCAAIARTGVPHHVKTAKSAAEKYTQNWLGSITAATATAPSAATRIAEALSRRDDAKEAEKEVQDARGKIAVEAAALDDAVTAVDKAVSEARNAIAAAGSTTGASSIEVTKAREAVQSLAAAAAAYKSASTSKNTAAVCDAASLGAKALHAATTHMDALWPSPGQVEGYHRAAQDAWVHVKWAASLAVARALADASEAYTAASALWEARAAAIRLSRHLQATIDTSATTAEATGAANAYVHAIAARASGASDSETPDDTVEEARRQADATARQFAAGADTAVDKAMRGADEAVKSAVALAEAVAIRVMANEPVQAAVDTARRAGRRPSNWRKRRVRASVKDLANASKSFASASDVNEARNTAKSLETALNEIAGTLNISAPDAVLQFQNAAHATSRENLSFKLVGEVKSGVSQAATEAESLRSATPPPQNTFFEAVEKLKRASTAFSTAYKHSNAGRISRAADQVATRVATLPPPAGMPRAISDAFMAAATAAVEVVRNQTDDVGGDERAVLAAVTALGAAIRQIPAPANEIQELGAACENYAYSLNFSTRREAIEAASQSMKEALETAVTDPAVSEAFKTADQKVREAIGQAEQTLDEVADQARVVIEDLTAANKAYLAACRETGMPGVERAASILAARITAAKTPIGGADIPLAPRFTAATDTAQKKLALWVGSGRREAWARAAVKYLNSGDVDRTVKEWRPLDPQLNRLRADPSYLGVFGRSPSKDADFLSIPQLEPYKAGLTRIGAITPHTLVQYSAKTLTERLQVPWASAREIVRVAKIASSVPSDLGKWRVDLTAAYLELEAKQRPVRDSGKLYETLTALRLTETPPREELDNWLHHHP